jgi:hypothetical protein
VYQQGWESSRLGSSTQWNGLDFEVSFPLVKVFYTVAHPRMQEAEADGSYRQMPVDAIADRQV